MEEVGQQAQGDTYRKVTKKDYGLVLKVVSASNAANANNNGNASNNTASNANYVAAINPDEQINNYHRVQRIRRTRPSTKKVVNKQGDAAGYVQWSYQHSAL